MKILYHGGLFEGAQLYFSTQKKKRMQDGTTHKTMIDDEH